MTGTIEKTVELRAPIDRVWRAIADHREFGAWFGIDVRAPFVVGEKAVARFVDPLIDINWEVRVIAIEPPTRFAFTWVPYAIDPEHDYSGETPTTVEFRLEAQGAGTRLTVTESGFEGVPETRRALALRMNEGGWAQQVENIRAHVDG